MLHQHLRKQQRQENVLILDFEAKDFFGLFNFPLIPTLVGFLSFVLFVFIPAIEIIAILLKYTFFLSFIVCLILLIGQFLKRQTIRIDAGTLQLEQYFELGNFRLPITIPIQVFNRQQLPQPVSWIVWTANEGKKSPFFLKNKYRYEVRIPLAATGSHGLICVHQSEEEMDNFEKTLLNFLKEVPYQESVWLGTLETLPQDVQEKISQSEDHLSHFSTIGYRDDIVPHEPEKPKKMVTVNYNETKKTLTLVSENGDTTSKMIGHFSLQFYRWFTRCFNLAVFAAVFVMIYQWQNVKPVIVQMIDHVEMKIAVKFGFQNNEPQLITNLQQTVFDFVSDENPLWSDIVIGFIFAAPLLIISSILISIFFSLFRWYFWNRWAVRLEPSFYGQDKMIAERETDRTKIRCLSAELFPFFRPISATPQTHRMLTNRRLFDFNPAWRQPFQVVIATAAGSFPIPVADQEEQKEIIRKLNEFLNV